MSGREPWSSGYGMRLTSDGRGFDFRLDGHFFTLISYVNCNVCLKKTKMN